MATEKILTFRQEMEAANKTMFCPLIKNFCKTTTCMFYEDIAQNCSITMIAINLRNPEEQL